MSDDKIVGFPKVFARLGPQVQSATLDSEMDPHNPHVDSLHALLKKRADLTEKYTSSDGSVREVEREICDRLAELAPKPEGL